MNCLANRIGLLGCGAPSSEAVTANPNATPPVLAQPALPILTINQLPGISLGNIEALADDEQETYLGVWADVSLRAMKKFELLVKAQFNRCYRLTDKTVIECIVCENKDLFDVALWYLHGAELMIERTSTDTLSRFTTIDIEKAEALKADFYIEFERSLKDAVESISPSDSDCVEECLECNQDIKFVYQLP
jgi:hypothetical protein